MLRQLGYIINYCQTTDTSWLGDVHEFITKQQTLL